MALYKLVFSPTGGSKMVADYICDSLATSQYVDLCDDKVDLLSLNFEPIDLVFVVVPVYGGRVPEVAINRIKNLIGNDAKCIAVCCYNRDYGDALLELVDSLIACHFQLLGIIAAVTRHTIFPKYSHDRPNYDDNVLLQSFTRRILENRTQNDIIPGNRPYRKRVKNKLYPNPKMKKCIKCAKCLFVCPVDAIDRNTFLADGNKCICCLRCVTVCPVKGRKINPIVLNFTALKLHRQLKRYHENEVYLLRP